MSKRVLSWLLSPAGVTALACGGLLAFILAQAEWNPFELIHIGTHFSEGAADGSIGYDGQFFYYIARDLNPGSVAAHLDAPAYRYQRILLPVLAKLLSFGQAAWLPWALIAVGPISHVLGVQVLARLFARWGINPWYALAYGLLPGNLMAIRLGLPEPLAFTLVICAIWLGENGRPRWAWLCWVLALFAKETTIFFAAAQGLVYLFERRWKDVLGFGLSVALPMAAFRLWLLAVFGSPGFGVGDEWGRAVWVPFGGLWQIGRYDGGRLLPLALFYAPLVIIPVGWGLWAAGRRLGDAARKASPPDFVSLTLLLNAAVFLFLPTLIYIEHLGVLRLAVGLQLACLLFAARHRVGRVLNYSFLWALFNALLFA